MPAKSKKRKQQRRVPPAPSPNRGSLRLGLALLALVAVNIYFFVYRDGTSIPDVMEKAALAGDLERTPLIDLDSDLDSAESGDDTAVIEEADEDDDPGTAISGEVGKGDSLIRILSRHGIGQKAAHGVVTALAADLKRIFPGQSYRLHLAPSGEISRFEYQVSRVETVVATREGDAFTVSKQKAPTKVVEAEVGGVIRSSLYQSIKDAGEDMHLVGFFVDVFAYDLNFYVDTHPGDTFRIIIEKEYLDGEFLRYGRVLGAEYRGLAGTFRALRFEAPGDEAEYYNEDGESVAKTFLKTPLKFTRISSKFNPRRMHPVLHRRKGHFGVDYAAPTGTPIWSAASGKIVFRGRRGGAGNCVIVKHENGYTTTYMHMSKFRKGQRVGSRVRQKEVIGYVGSTGLATGPHLHFGLKYKGRYVDPLRVKMSRTERVAKAHRASFNKAAGALMARLAKIETGAPAQ